MKFPLTIILLALSLAYAGLLDHNEALALRQIDALNIDIVIAEKRGEYLALRYHKGIFKTSPKAYD